MYEPKASSMKKGSREEDPGHKFEFSAGAVSKADFSFHGSY